VRKCVNEYLRECVNETVGGREKACVTVRESLRKMAREGEKDEGM